MSTKPTLTVQLMHAQARISGLEQQLADLARELLDSQTTCDVLTAKLTAKPANTNRKVIAPRPEWVRPAWMEAARQQAMTSGSVVLA